MDLWRCEREKRGEKCKLGVSECDLGLRWFFFLWLTKKGMMRKAKGGRERNERERKKAVRGKWSDAVHSRQGDTSSSGSAGQWVKICTRF